MFRLVQRRVLFTLDDRDLALALVEVEGYIIVDCENHAKPPRLVEFHRTDKSKRGAGVEAEQVSPGVFSYFIMKKRGKKC